MSKAIYLLVQKDPTFKERNTVVTRKPTAATRKPAARKAAAAPAAEEVTAVDLLTALREFLNTWAQDNDLPPFEGGAKAAPASAKAKAAAAKAAADEDEDDEDEDDDSSRRAELNAMSIPELRKLARAAGYDKDEVAAAKKADLVDTLLAEEDGQDDEDVPDETPDDEGDEDDEEEGYTHEALRALNLREIQRIAREEYEAKAADYKGMDKDALIEYLLGDEEADEDEDDEEGGEEDGYTEEDLNAMSLAELREIAKEYGVKLRVGMKKAAIVTAILNAQE